MKVFVSQRIYPEGLDILEQAGLEVDLNDANPTLAQKGTDRNAPRVRTDSCVC